MLVCIIVMTIWKEAGFFMIFYLAALQAISPELREAATVEGASRWTYFWRIVFPLLMPTTLFVSINALINAFKLVDHLFILTKGGPDNASNLLLYYIYEAAFSFFDTAYAATLTTVLLAFLAVVAVSQFFLFDRQDSLPMTGAGIRQPGRWLRDRGGLAPRGTVADAAALCLLGGISSAGVRHAASIRWRRSRCRIFPVPGASRRSRAISSTRS